jgi:hypothetical protein
MNARQQRSTSVGSKSGLLDRVEQFKATRGIAPRTFISDWEVWEASLRDAGESEAGVAEIKTSFREMLSDDRREWAIGFVKEKADEIRGRYRKPVIVPNEREEQ